MRSLIRPLFGMALVLSFGLSAIAAPPAVWTVTEGCDAPESAYYDAEHQTIFISQIGGDGGKKDGKGWISKVSPDGKVIAAKWVEGLNAPKGIRGHKNRLWVSDLDELVGIDIQEGKIAERVKVPGAKFLNDVATGSDGTAYVTDMLDSKVYAYANGKLSVFAEGDSLESPNGILIDGDKMILGAWGLNTDFMPKVPGRLLALDMKSKKVTPITEKPTGNLDGVESDGQGGYIVTDWLAGKVMHISAKGETTEVAAFEKGTADHAYLPAKKLLILPHMMENKVIAYDLSKLVK